MKTVIAVLMAFAMSMNAGTAQEYLKQGDACYAQKDYKCAYDNYMKGLEAGLNANKAVLYFRLGFCLNQDNKAAEAKKWLWMSLKEKSDQIDANWTMANCQYKLKNYDSSAYYYTRTYNNQTVAKDKFSTSYWAGYTYYYASNYAEALKWIDIAVGLEPDNYAAVKHKGDVELARNTYDAAEITYRKAIILADKDSVRISTCYQKLGSAYYNHQKYSEGATAYRVSYMYDKYYTTGLAAAGDCFQQLKNYDSMDYYYEKAVAAELAMDPGETDSSLVTKIYETMVKVRLINKDTALALTKYLPKLIKFDEKGYVPHTYVNIAIERNDPKIWEAVIPAYISDLQKSKRNIDAASWQVKLGNAYKRIKQPAKALPYFRSALASAPTEKAPVMAYVSFMADDKKLKQAYDTLKKYSSAIKATDLSDVKLLEADLAYKMKDTAAAARICKEILAMPSSGKPANFTFNANYLMGQMALERKDSTATTLYWERLKYSLATYKTDYNLYEINRYLGFNAYKRAGANTYSAASEYRSAGDLFKRALAIDSSQGIVRLFCGYAYISGGTRKEGHDQLLAAAKMYARKKDTLATIYRVLGSSEYRATPANYTGALAYYQQALNATPSDSNTVSDIGVVQYQLKEYTKAGESFGKLINMYKSTKSISQAYYNRALCHYQNKDKAKALADIEKSLELNPQYAEPKKLKTEVDKLTN